jgi:hypothetical protein
MIRAQATRRALLALRQAYCGRTRSDHLTMMNGGAGRDRTDDLKLAKLPLSQLSYGPNDQTKASEPDSQTWIKSDLVHAPHNTIQ